MEWKKKNQNDIIRQYNYELANGTSLPLLKFPLLEQFPGVEHCFTTRLGGVSRDHLSSLNLSYNRGDERANVDENYRRLAEALHTDCGSFVFTDQTHTTNVLRVGRAERGYGITRPRPYTDVDGLVTNEPGVVLSTFFADCVPLYFVDPVHRAIGLSHSGWRGTVGRMGERTLEKMASEFGTNPRDVYAAVGPSICQDCYEVSADVADAFAAEFAGHADDILRSGKNGKYQLDLWESNRIVLCEAGVLPEHLAITNVCTCCNPELLFSHRASRGMRGNLGAFLFLLPECGSL
jgi:hypothetical protein